jgi:hypothetical protein
MTRKGRKLTESTLTESRALVESMQKQAAVLAAWHPQLISLAIVVQQLAALAGDLNGRALQAAPEPEPTA